MLTYLQFHAAFLLPAVATVATVTGVRSTDGWWRPLRLGVPLMVGLALVWTTPWDNYLIARGVWWYGDGTVVGRLWRAPLEEYLFIAVQPLVTGLWCAQVSPPPAPRLSVQRRDRLLGAAAGAAVGLAGVAMLATPATFYLGAILAWAAPVLALQWAFGWPYLWRARRAVVAGVAVPTVYLWLADAVALRAGVWVLADRYTTGLAVGGLPIEEAAFFLVTNLFVVQGLVLLRWVMRR
jgi:lycopene cyclase domain-containing protein